MSQAPQAALAVGIAEAVVTPPWSTSLWGYDNHIRWTSGAHDDLFAKVFLLEAGKRFLIVLLDVGAIGFGLTRQIVQKIRMAVNIDPEAVAVQCSHNHSAPAVLGVPAIAADERYQGLLVDKISLAVRKAERNMTDAVVEYGRTDSFIALNRRVGNRRSTWDKPSGPIDSALNVLLFRRLSGGNLGAIVNYPTHPVTLREDMEQISADFPGVLYRELGNRLGCPVGYMQGCCGEMIPKVFGTLAETEDYGRRLADEATRAFAGREPLAVDSLDWRSARVALTFLAPYTLEEFRTHYAGYFERSHWVGEWAKRYLRYLEDGGDLRELRDTVVRALRLGDLMIAFLPGEVLHLTSLLIRREFPGHRLITAAYANDVSIGYMPHADEFPKGRYEVTDGWKYYGTLQSTPDGEAALRDTAVRLLNELRSRP